MRHAANQGNLRYRQVFVDDCVHMKHISRHVDEVNRIDKLSKMAESETSLEPPCDEVRRLECAVCLLTCVHPVKLPCGHIFCFLCMKGVANRNRRCAMCRKEIPSDYPEHPVLVSDEEPKPSADPDDDGYRWFYEGHNGWWQYDERTGQELQSGFSKGERTFELLIAGFLYVLDFDNMVQFRRNDPSRRRRFKRDLATIPKKGVAGLRNPQEDPATVDSIVNALADVNLNEDSPAEESDGPSVESTDVQYV